MASGEVPDSAQPESQHGTVPIFIHFFGMRRSGNHAVINWLQEGLMGDGEAVMFVNNVAEVASTGPLPERQPINIERKVAQTHPDFVILSYEERTVGDRHDLEHRREFSNDGDQDLVLLRSFPNWMASQVQRRRNVIKEGRLNRPILRLGLTAIRDMWVENAQAILGASDSALTGILYDRWFTDRDYRDEIGHRVGFTNTDSGLDHVPNIIPGVGGSSFDGDSFQGRAQQMGVLDRWRMFTESGRNLGLYLSLITPEVVELNQELFGSYPSITDGR